MPLNADAENLIRTNLQAISRGERAPKILIGKLSDEQLKALRTVRREHDLPEITGGDVVFIGKHIYQSRIERNGYSIEDVVLQIKTAMDPTSICKSPTSIESIALRHDAYGNIVRDKAVFECTSRQPYLELFSVVPSGDHISPKDAAKERGRKAAP